MILSWSICAESFNIKQYLESDFLLGESIKKEKLQKESTQQLLNHTKNKYRYPSVQDFWKFASEYWLVKNIDVLKWDRASDASLYKKGFEQLLATLNKKGITFKIIVSPTSWISHFVLPRGTGNYIFVVSLPFITEAKLTTEDVLFVMLEDLIRIEKGYLFDFLKDESFFKKLGSDFYVNKKPNMSDFEKMMEQMSYFYKQYGYSFDQEFRVTRELIELIKNDEPLTQKYEGYSYKLSKLGEKFKQLFPKDEGLYPGLMIKKSWLKK